MKQLSLIINCGENTWADTEIEKVEMKWGDYSFVKLLPTFIFKEMHIISEVIIGELQKLQNLLQLSVFKTYGK